MGIFSVGRYDAPLFEGSRNSSLRDTEGPSMRELGGTTEEATEKEIIAFYRFDSLSIEGFSFAA